MQFCQVNIGDQFYDPYSGEYFRKISNTHAEFMSGGDYFGNQPCDFEQNEEVENAGI